jgi:NAD(P)H-hydrate repair Nnr-like enzyme with NAD(P)H-hydrate dehydratase domain
MGDGTLPFWVKQAPDKPLFPGLLWSRPENRMLAGKLLIIGGNAFGFAAPGQAYAEAQKAGVGVAHVLLPDKLSQTVGRVLEAGDFAPSTPSGSFSQKALTDFMIHSAWADGVLLAGDLGRNSETAILLEKFVGSYHGQLTITKDAADYFAAAPQALLTRPETTMVASFAQLQKMALSAKFSRVFTFSMDILSLVAALHQFTNTYGVNIVVKHLQNIFVASGGSVSSTKLAEDVEVWRVATAAHAAVWWLQNPGKPFEALTTAVHEASQT